MSADRKTDTTTPEERRARTAAATAARIREGNERRIAELITTAPLLTDEQRARLDAVLNGQPAGIAP
jgi:hypothetical protein